jgi:prephenate dehydrogenase
MRCTTSTWRGPRAFAMTFPSEAARSRAAVVGTGLIGGSIGLALRARGWFVSGTDLSDQRARTALRIGALDRIGTDPSAEIIFVATPVSSIATEARAALARGARGAVVTDVGGVKGPVVTAIGDPRFVGGHPMAGSEQEGVEGSDPELFSGTTWVLTPDKETDPAAFAKVRSVVASLGAEVVALDPDRHDALVAVVSHVPHLAAATLMKLASEGGDGSDVILRLAAGGFRDMTRVAAGDPAIWPDVCVENAGAIVEGLDRLIGSLSRLRQIVSSHDRSSLLDVLESARAARQSLPVRYHRPDELAEIRVPVPDESGQLAEITTLASELGVNIEDMEIAHSSEGDRGVLLVVVAAAASDALKAALGERGYRSSVRRLG